MQKNLFRSSFVVLAIAGITACGSDESQEAAAAPAAMPATYILPEVAEVAETKHYLGRFDVLDRVELQPRVSGYIDSVKFKDGQTVKKGQLLFVIDQRPFKLALDRAEAELTSAEAALDLAQKEWDRGEELRELDALSQEQLDQRAQNLQAAKSRQAQAKVALKQAKLDLTYSRVTSPINGKVGQRNVSVGNLVQSGNTHLATIVATAPLYFNFEMSESDAMKFQVLNAETPQQFNVSVGTTNPQTFSATFDFMDVQTDRSTGTIATRAVLDTTPETIKPGMFGKTELPLTQPQSAFLVPDTLIGSNQHMKTLMVITPENTIGFKPVQVGGLVEGKRVVWSGISADEKIVATGTQMLQPGMPVTPMPKAAPNEVKGEGQDQAQTQAQEQ